MKRTGHCAGPGRAWDRVNCLTQAYGSAEGRIELKARENYSFFILSFISPYFILHESTFFFWDAVFENPSGLRPSQGGLRHKMGRS